MTAALTLRQSSCPPPFSQQRRRAGRSCHRRGLPWASSWPQQLHLQLPPCPTPAGCPASWAPVAPPMQPSQPTTPGLASPQPLRTCWLPCCTAPLAPTSCTLPWQLQAWPAQRPPACRTAAAVAAAGQTCALLLGCTPRSSTPSTPPPCPCPLATGWAPPSPAPCASTSRGPSIPTSLTLMTARGRAGAAAAAAAAKAAAAMRLCEMPRPFAPLPWRTAARLPCSSRPSVQQQHQAAAAQPLLPSLTSFPTLAP